MLRDEEPGERGLGTRGRSRGNLPGYFGATRGKGCLTGATGRQAGVSGGEKLETRCPRQHLLPEGRMLLPPGVGMVCLAAAEPYAVTPSGMRSNARLVESGSTLSGKLVGASSVAQGGEGPGAILIMLLMMGLERSQYWDGANLLDRTRRALGVGWCGEWKKPCSVCYDFHRQCQARRHMTCCGCLSAGRPCH